MRHTPFCDCGDCERTPLTKTLNYGDIPTDLTIDEPYAMELNASDEQIVVAIVNQGIDAHLEAVFFDDHGIRNSKRCIDIKDSASMRCFLRRCVESDDEETQDFAACIVQTLGIEWI